MEMLNVEGAPSTFTSKFIEVECLVEREWVKCHINKKRILYVYPTGEQTKMVLNEGTVLRVRQNYEEVIGLLG